MCEEGWSEWPRYRPVSETGPKGRTLAEKLEHLFATVHPRGRKPYTLDEVAAGIAGSGDEPISANYIWMLRKGQRDNPTIKTVEALAHFFGVPPAYFLGDDDLALRVDSQLELLAKMRDAGVASLGLRSSELTPESRAAIAKMIDVASEAMAKMIDAVVGMEAPGPDAEDEAPLP